MKIARIIDTLPAYSYLSEGVVMVGVILVVAALLRSVLKWYSTRLYRLGLGAMVFGEQGKGIWFFCFCVLLPIGLIGLLGLHIKTCVLLCLTWMLLLLSALDLRHYALPDELTLSALWLGLFCNAQNVFVPCEAAVWGAALGYLGLRTIGLCFSFCRGLEGIGRGDMKLFAALGAWFGYRSLPFILLFASLLGLCYALCLRFRGISRPIVNLPIAFGPCLAVGGFVVMSFNQLGL